MEDANYSFRQIGIVRSSLREVRDAPNQAFEGAPEALLEIDPTFAPALHRVTAGQDLILLTWLHRADRSVLQTHPHGDPNTPLTGVFATRSSERPNPIGLHRVTITAIESPTLLRASSLEAIDGTPIASPSLVHSSAVDHAANPRETALVPPAENKALIRRFYEEAWDQGKLDVIDDVFCRSLRPPRPARDASGTWPGRTETNHRRFRAAFPDLRFRAEIMLAEDEFVAARWTATGSHSGRWGHDRADRPPRHILRRQRLPLRERESRRDLEPPRRPRPARAARRTDLRRRSSKRLTA